MHIWIHYAVLLWNFVRDIVCADVLCCDYGVLLFRLGVFIIRVSGTQTLNYMAKLIYLLPS